MTDLAGALADVSQLGSFDGMPIVRTSIAITNAGDGLSQAMRTEPRLLHQGDTVYVVLEAKVQEVHHVPVDKDDPGGVQVRKHKLKAGTATLVDAELVKAHIADQAERNRLAVEAARGVQRIPWDGPGEPPADDGIGEVKEPAPIAGRARRGKKADAPTDPDAEQS